MIRAEQEGFSWAERVVGGRIVRKLKHDNWRPQWFLDIQLPDGSVRKVMLRGFRDPGGGADDGDVREGLTSEAEVLRALQDLPVSVPYYYGHDAEHGWMLMERIEGDAELSQVFDPDRRFALFQDYMEDIARLHAFPVDKMALPANMARPASSRDQWEEFKRTSIATYRSLERTQPEPILELGIQWLQTYHLPSERPLSFGLSDVGPNQFMFAGSEYLSLIDFELGVLADPLLAIGLMRVRELVYSIGRMPEHVAHYGKHYEALTGIPLDHAALRYMTVASTVLFNLPSAATKIAPDPTLPDLVFTLSWEIPAQRGILEAMAEYHGISLSVPDLPSEKTTILKPLHDLITGQIEQFYAPRSRDQGEKSFARYSAALVKTLARGNAVAGRIDQDNMKELSALIGNKVDDWYEGLYELERLIVQDSEHDFEARLNFLYRVQVRREYLYEPMQCATGCSVGVPLVRLESLEGVVPSAIPLRTL
ncbi:phosphotransferase [Sphingomonas sp.]|uniref:phosphotransferase n=1 Tax=Sphingomonas sp. TaxID=28214 RepID=UPI003B00237E